MWKRCLSLATKAAQHAATDERRAEVAAFRGLAPAPLAVER